MQGLYDWLWSYGGFFLFLVIVLLLATLGVVAWLVLQLRHDEPRQRASIAGGGDGHLDAVLGDQLQQVQEATRQTLELHASVQRLVWAGRGYLQRVGFLRFNAFTDSGGDQSFALALTDLDGNGVVISSLHGRDSNRVYAKPLVGWNSSYSLTTEEQQVIREAFDPTWDDARD